MDGLERRRRHAAVATRRQGIVFSDNQSSYRDGGEGELYADVHNYRSGPCLQRVDSEQRGHGRGGPDSFNWDVTADGQKFLLATVATQEHPPQPPINVVMNWTALLKK